MTRGNYSGVRSQESGVRMKRELAKHFQDLIVLSACNAQAGWQKATIQADRL
jgi:hypothetical protein